MFTPFTIVFTLISVCCVTFAKDSDQSTDNFPDLSEIDEKLEDFPNSFSDINPSEEIKGNADIEETIEKLYQTGMGILNRTNRRSAQMRIALKHLLVAAYYNHTGALEEVGMAALFGDGIPLSLELAREAFQRLSKSGNPRGQLGLGFLYATGLGVDSNQAKSLLFLTFSALGDDIYAQMAMGYRYWSGLGVETSCETALVYYSNVAKLVADRVTHSSGLAIHRIRIIDEVETLSSLASGSATSSTATAIFDDDLLQYYHFLADKGDISAQLGLGQIYFQGGRGVEVDYIKANHYLNMAAKAGNSNAMAFLGKMYMNGLSNSIVASNKTAFEYFTLAANKDNAIGLSGLGIMYLQGRGVDQNYTTALKYFSMAADQGWVEGQLYLGIIYLNGLGVKKDYKSALKYLNLASQHGNVLAFYNLAQMHSSGTGVLRSCSTAAELYKSVAERGRWGQFLMEAHSAYQHNEIDAALVKYMFLAELGYEVAQSNTAYLLDIIASNPSGTVSNFFSKSDASEALKRALVQWNRSAMQGNSISRVKVGDYHYYGMGTEIDYRSAAQSYRIASETQHNPQAIFNLGYMHEHGLGMKRDIHLAKRFYDMAAEASSDAVIPVSLALARLSFYFFWEYIHNIENVNEVFTALHPSIFFGPRWDLYFLPILIGILFLLIIIYQQSRAQRLRFLNPPDT